MGLRERALNHITRLCDRITEENTLSSGMNSLIVMPQHCGILGGSGSPYQNGMTLLVPSVCGLSDSSVCLGNPIRLLFQGICRCPHGTGPDHFYEKGTNIHFTDGEVKT